MPLLSIDPLAPDPDLLREAADWLRRRGIVAFPTDTFYGLAVDPASKTAVAALFALKGRPAHLAMPLVAASTAQVDEWCGGLDPASARLARVFWPGPLSLIVDVPPGVVDAVHGGVRSVAVRVPAHVVARALAASFGAPITATSANRSGAVPAAVAGALGALAEDPQVLVIDSGPTPGGEPSTIVDARHAPPRLVRAGAVAWERVLDSIHP